MTLNNGTAETQTNTPWARPASVSSRSNRETEPDGQPPSQERLGNEGNTLPRSGSIMEGFGEDSLLLPCLAASDRKEVIC